MGIDRTIDPDLEDGNVRGDDEENFSDLGLELMQFRNDENRINRVTFQRQNVNVTGRGNQDILL
jgi:hypothetical protein